MSELEQTKKVLDVIANLINEKETCTYRHLIYDLLEFKEDAYSELISGLTITNFLVYVEELEDRIYKAIEFIKENENNISSIKDLENNKTYNSALLSVKDILQGVDKE